MWLQSMNSFLPEDQISGKQFPKVFAWLERFQATVTAAAKVAGKAQSVKGPDAAKKVGAAEFAEDCGGVENGDPTGLKAGQVVEVFPIESGFANKDRGKLIGLSVSEIVVESKTEDGNVVRLHTPRHGFRVRAAGSGRAAL
jgi:hypothetical protein